MAQPTDVGNKHPAVNKVKTIFRTFSLPFKEPPLWIFVPPYYPRSEENCNQIAETPGQNLKKDIFSLAYPNYLKLGSAQLTLATV
ncbi:MAG: hypothetical protein EBQ92_05980 [Proteobacteria bacterium]|nr:hypothetical protein [Pseudomonadota bacterium]